MTDATTLRDLYDRLEKATGPDREIDLAVEAAVLGYPLRWCLDKTAVTYDRYGPDATGNPVFSAPEAFTASLDAVKALHDRLLPGWEATLESDNGRWVSAVYTDDGVDDYGWKIAPTPALAWLKAIVEAKIKEAENG